MNELNLMITVIGLVIVGLLIAILILIFIQIKFQHKIIHLMRGMLWANWVAAANIERKLAQISRNTYFLTDKKHDAKKYSD